MLLDKANCSRRRPLPTTTGGSRVSDFGIVHGFGSGPPCPLIETELSKFMRAAAHLALLTAHMYSLSICAPRAWDAYLRSFSTSIVIAITSGLISLGTCVTSSPSCKLRRLSLWVQKR